MGGAHEKHTWSVLLCPQSWPVMQMYRFPFVSFDFSVFKKGVDLLCPLLDTPLIRSKLTDEHLIGVLLPRLEIKSTINEPHHFRHIKVVYIITSMTLPV